MNNSTPRLRFDLRNFYLAKIKATAQLHREIILLSRSQMADPKLIVAIVLGILALVLISIAGIIALVISGKYPAGDTKTRLRASGVLSFLTAAFAVATGFVGILYARAKAALSASARALMIALIVLAVITGLMYVTIIGLNLSLRSREEVKPVDKNALTAAIIMIALGFVSLAVSTIMIFIIKRPGVVTKTTTTALVTTPAVVVPASTTAVTTTTVATKPSPPVPARPARAIIPSRVIKTTTTTPVVRTLAPTAVIKTTTTPAIIVN